MLRSLPHFTLALGLAAASLAACPSSSTPPAGRLDAAVPDDRRAEAGAADGGDASAAAAPSFGASYCERRMQCAGAYGFPYDDLAACEALMAQESAAGARDAMRAQCAEALSTTDCEDLVTRDWPAPCKAIVVDARTRRADGDEVCDGWTLCDAGLFCHYTAEDCGRCQPLRDLGQACTDFLECESGRCAEGRCARPATAGANCDTGRDCQSGRCDSGRCAEIALEGDACELDVECESGTYCFQGVCRDFAVPRLGDACSGACRATRDGVGWSAGLACVEGVCVEAPGAGEACSAFVCREGYTCIEGACQAIIAGGAYGEACRWNSCGAGLCVLGVCTRAAQVGEAWLGSTLVNGGCETDAYPGFEDGQHLCLPRSADGEPCEQHAQCLGGLCDADGRCARSACSTRG